MADLRPVLRIRIQDPVLFDHRILNPGWKKIFTESLETITKILLCGCGSGIFFFRNTVYDLPYLLYQANINRKIFNHPTSFAYI
jgi:hypothetical protein